MNPRWMTHSIWEVKTSDLKKIDKICTDLREIGVKSLKTSNFELILIDPNTPEDTKTLDLRVGVDAEHAQEVSTPTSFPVEISDEDMLFWSVEQMDEPQEDPIATASDAIAPLN